MLNSNFYKGKTIYTAYGPIKFDDQGNADRELEKKQEEALSINGKINVKPMVKPKVTPTPKETPKETSSTETKTATKKPAKRRRVAKKTTD